MAKNVVRDIGRTTYRPILLSTCDDQLSVFKNTSYDLNNLAALTDFELIFITYFFVCAVN